MVSWNVLDPADLVETSSGYIDCKKTYDLAAKAESLLLYCEVAGKGKATSKHCAKLHLYIFDNKIVLLYLSR